jgi:hypothetical protein
MRSIPEMREKIVEACSLQQKTVLKLYYKARLVHSWIGMD